MFHLLKSLGITFGIVLTMINIVDTKVENGEIKSTDFVEEQQKVEEKVEEKVEKQKKTAEDYGYLNKKKKVVKNENCIFRGEVIELEKVMSSFERNHKDNFHYEIEEKDEKYIYKFFIGDSFRKTVDIDKTCKNYTKY